MRTQVLSGGANAKTCPNSCCWPQTAPMKGAENFPQTKNKKNKKLGQFSLEFRQNILFTINNNNFSPSGEIHPQKQNHCYILVRNSGWYFLNLW